MLVKEVRESVHIVSDLRLLPTCFYCNGFQFTLSSARAIANLKDGPGPYSASQHCEASMQAGPANERTNASQACLIDGDERADSRTSILLFAVFVNV